MSVFQLIVVFSFIFQFGLEVWDLKVKLVIFSEQLIDFPLKFDVLLIFEIELTNKVLILFKSHGVFSLEILSFG